VFDKVEGFFDFVLGVLYVGAVPSLFVGLYSYLVLYLMVLAAAEWRLGVFVWGVPAVMLAPVIVVWYWVLSRRYRAYVEMLMASQPLKWDIDSAIRSLQELSQSKKRKGKKA